MHTLAGPIATANPNLTLVTSKGITVAAMHQQSGDIHHIVPKDYLQKTGYPDRGDYNEVANFALTETNLIFEHVRAGLMH